jgi:hypothetical protein
MVNGGIEHGPTLIYIHKTATLKCNSIISE